MRHYNQEKSEVSQLEQALASGPVGKTILFYAIPSVVSLVVNGLYNIVDQIFIGQGIGYLWNSATNVIFPLTVFAAAVGILFGAVRRTLRLRFRDSPCGYGNCIKNQSNPAFYHCGNRLRRTAAYQL